MFKRNANPIELMRPAIAGIVHGHVTLGNKAVPIAGNNAHTRRRRVACWSCVMVVSRFDQVRQGLGIRLLSLVRYIVW